MKWCNKCKQWKDESKFNWSNKKKGYLKSWCRECTRRNGKDWHERNQKENNRKSREYRWEHREYFREMGKKYYFDNKEHYNERRKEWRADNLEYAKKLERKNGKKSSKKRRISPVNFELNIRKQIELYEKIRKSTNGNIEVRCTYCGEWFEPNLLQIQSRLGAISGRLNGEARLYCSNKCKENCPIYGQQKWPKDQKPATSREVQPQLRQLVFQRDNYICQKCGNHRDELNTGIHCHHMEGVQWNPIESADEDICITLCEECHKEVHDQDGCRYHELKCSN